MNSRPIYLQFTALFAFPKGSPRDSRLLVSARAFRGFADGLVSVMLATYLNAIGFSPLQIGAVVTATLLGSAALTLSTGMLAHRLALRSVLLGASALMFATGLGFAVSTSFWLVIGIAMVGTLNPSSGDVSLFLPTEQAMIAGLVPDHDRPRLYAIYNVAGVLAGAFGALAAALPGPIARAMGWQTSSVQRCAFLLYGLVAIVVFFHYLSLREHRHRPQRSRHETQHALGSARRTIYELSALFSLDSAASGFVGTSLLVLWLHLRFSLSPAATGILFFIAGILGAASQFLAGPLAKRIGLVRTMAYTHLPANGLLVLAALAPSAGLAITALLLRALFAQMDVPARQSFVMAVVEPEHRAAAASVTNVPRALASAMTPLLAGWMLSKSSFGWPLVAAGLIKIAYDLLLLFAFRRLPEIAGAQRRKRNEPEA
ncbi:MAG: MFS transporter [Actinobacteria bacterium]|nr:MFS transporter [Actinomycetota bacterium]